MFLLIISILFSLMTVFYRGRRSPSKEKINVFTTIAISAFCLSIIVTGIEYTVQIRDIEDVKKFDNITSIYEQMDLTEKINQLQTDKYEQLIKKEEVLKDMRFRLRNPWIFYWLLPYN